MELVERDGSNVLNIGVAGEMTVDFRLAYKHRVDHSIMVYDLSMWKW